MYFFELLLTEQFIQELVTKINKYAEKTINSSCPWRRGSNLVNWKDVSFDEMTKFFGIVFAMSSNINEVIKAVLNSLFFLRKDFALTKSTKSTKRHKDTRAKAQKRK